MTVDATQGRIRTALAGVLGPLARTLLRCGVSYAEFAEMSKRAFVAAASDDYGVRNRPTNIARVAVMTGLSRKEVRRLRSERKHKASLLPVQGSFPAAVLNLWHTNRSYSMRSGAPRGLSFADGRYSFSTLVRSISTDIPPGAMRRELVRAGAVRTTDRNRLIPVKRHFVPDSADERMIVGIELGLRRLVETLVFNSDPNRRGHIRFQRVVEGPLIRVVDLADVRHRLHEFLGNFSLTVDDYLSSFETDKKRSSVAKSTAFRAGVGFYYFDDSAD